MTITPEHWDEDPNGYLFFTEAPSMERIMLTTDRYRLRDGRVGTFEEAASEVHAFFTMRMEQARTRLLHLQQDLITYHQEREANRPCLCGSPHPGYLGNCICGHSYAHHLAIFEDGTHNHRCDRCPTCSSYRYDRLFSSQDRREAHR